MKSQIPSDKNFSASLGKKEGILRVSAPGCRMKGPGFFKSLPCPSARKRFLLTGLILAWGFLLATPIGKASEEFPVSPPPMTEGIFPCSGCHAFMEVNPRKRELKEEHRRFKLHHAEALRWCLDCHDPKNRDKLRLYNGELIGFTESYRLCGECHGPVYRDWKAGIHGKRTGYFAGGKRTYYLCAHCHDPHEPKFKPLRPEPPPREPKD